MTADILLHRLAELRRRSEQQALHTVVLQNKLCRLAEHKAGERARAALRQVSEARLRERSLLAPLIGRAVSKGAITGVQAEIARIALETARFRSMAASAQAAFLDQRDKCATALQYFRSRQRAAAKLDLLLQQETARRSKRQAALSELHE